MPIKDTIEKLDELREKWERLIELGKAEPEWKRKVILNFTNQLNRKELVGLEAECAKFSAELLVAFPQIIGEYESLRRAALASEALASTLESANHKYQGEHWQEGLSFEEQIYAALATYHKAIDE